VVYGPNIAPLRQYPALPARIETTVQLKVGDDITTDHIMPAGAQITALRSNIPAISQHVFERVDPTFASRIQEAGGGVIVGGHNYGQGSSREHAALAPRHLGVAAVVVKSLARIHRANLINFGILPLVLVDESDYDKLAQGQKIVIPARDVTPGGTISIDVQGVGPVLATNDLSAHELTLVRAGGLLNHVRNEKGA